MAKIYYAKNLRDLGMGWRFIEKNLPELMLKLETLDFSETHVLLTEEPENDLEKIFIKYQDNNEIGALVKENKDLHHTSMSVGDIVANESGTYYCDNDGWVKLN